MKKKVVSFGEIMLRLNPQGYYRFPQADFFCTAYTGAEANVCVALSRWGCNVNFVTKLPYNDISECANMTMRKYGVSTENTVWGGDRIGLYFLERGASQRPSKIIYDRKNTAISQSRRDEFDWEIIMKGADWFHLTGITPALGGKMSQICEDACQAAKRNNVIISFDLNYRSNLWSPEEAQKVMTKLVKYADIVIGNEEDAEKTLGIKPGSSDVNSGKLNEEDYSKSASEVVRRFGCNSVFYSLRTSISASDNLWQGMLYTNGASYFSKKYSMHVVDRVGGGDSFAAGAIFAMLEGYEAQKSIEFAVAASCLKHSIEMDFNLSTLAEVNSLMSGNTTGRVVR